MLARSLNAFAAWFSRHWLLLVTSIMMVYSVLPFVAPVLMKLGATSAAQLIYQPFKLVCHTYAFRSFFLFGQQLDYPRGQNSGVFQTTTGIALNPGGLLQAREFQGNEQLGYKVAVCERDNAIYLAIAFSGIAFAFVRKRARPLPWLLFILIGIIPIGIDGFWQLFSEYPLTLLPFHESTAFLRVVTGGMFGFSVAWLVFPMIEETMTGAYKYR